MTQPSALAVMRNRAAVAEELRRLLPRLEEDFRAAKAVPLGLSVIDRHLPRGGLPCGALHEIAPETQGAMPAAFGFVAALLIRRPRRFRTTSRPPSLPSPTRGKGKWKTLLRHAVLRAQPRPAAWPWPQRSRPRSETIDPRRDRPPQRYLVGHGGGTGFTRPASRRRDDRQARSEIEPKAAARRGGCRTASSAAAPRVDAGIERGDNALAHRHGQGRARPFRADRAGALASHA